MSGGDRTNEETRQVTFDMHSYGGTVPHTADMDENLEKRNQRRNKLFRRIQMDIKDRERQRKKMGHVKTVRYVDSQRDVSVELGERDIRREIMKHRGRLKNSMLADEADNPGFMLLLEQAEHELVAGQPDIATFYLDKAAVIHPDNVSVRALRGRSRLLCGQYESAMEDVSMILVQLNDPLNPTALLVQAGSFYAMGDFEHALVSYHRASTANTLLMRERDEITEGIRQSEEAIKNCLTKPENPFRNVEEATGDLGPNFLNQSLYELKSILTKSKIESKKSNFSKDMIYIENLLGKISSLGGGDHLTNLSSEAASALDYLVDRREFWSQHQPAGENK